MFDFEGAVFDMDGTIADSHYVWKKVDLDFFGKRGLDIPENYGEKLSSMSFREAAVFTKNNYGFLESPEEIMAEWYSMAIYEYSYNVKLKPFAGEYIESIKKKGVKTALCTASPKELYEPFLKRHNIFSYFDVFVSGSEVSRGKEFPDIYLLTADRLGILPERCVVFADIPMAVRGAKAAGMKTVGVFDENTVGGNRILIEKEADFFILDFSEKYTKEI